MVQWLSLPMQGSIPGRRAKIPRALQLKNQKHPKKQKQYGNKFNEDFKNGPHEKKILKKKKVKYAILVNYSRLFTLWIFHFSEMYFITCGHKTIQWRVLCVLFIKMELFYNVDFYSPCKIICVCLLNICHFEMLFFAVGYISVWFFMACFLIHAKKTLKAWGHVFVAWTCF